MKKCVFLLGVALLALGTTARAGTYEPDGEGSGAFETQSGGSSVSVTSSGSTVYGNNPTDGSKTATRSWKWVPAFAGEAPAPVTLSHQASRGAVNLQTIIQVSGKAGAANYFNSRISAISMSFSNNEAWELRYGAASATQQAGAATMPVALPEQAGQASFSVDATVVLTTMASVEARGTYGYTGSAYASSGSTNIKSTSITCNGIVQN